MVSHAHRRVPDGDPHPLGSHVGPDGVNFSVYAQGADRVELLLYDSVDGDEPARTIAMEQTRYYWHARVSGVRPGQIYGYRAHGPHQPARGLLFDGDKVLMDPYGRAVAVPSDYRREAAVAPGRNDRHAFKSVVVDAGDYDWEGDAPLRRSFAQTVIYELHVRGFTRHASSNVAEQKRGTYAGVIEKIPYLQDLGVTAVELLPVFQFDWQRAPANLTNYWGYAPVSFFAPHAGYGVGSEPTSALDEFRDMVKALHRAGIEVILDVVFGQTAEGGRNGATLSFRGLANAGYYILDGDTREHANYSGTGNTLNANSSVVRRMILDSLRYWVAEMHVDGFRFDLAAVLTRDETGHPLPNPPVLWDIETDPVLAGTKLIAEAWDAAGLYQVGSFIGDHWKEWNGEFRDDVRSFVRGDPGMTPRVAERVLGSPDLYGKRPRHAEQSINFVTCHDGFTLNDVVSYDHKHNEANGEEGRDGHGDNRSWNHGVEGPTDDPDIEALRNRQVKNMLALTLLSFGAPMLLMGDEVRRTQLGNNNAYCQDNELSWMDWRLLERHGDIHRFVRELIRLRFLRDSVRLAPVLTLADLREQANVEFHGVRLGQPDFTHPSRSLALSATSLSGDLRMYYAINAWTQPLEFELPPAPRTLGWRRVLDTFLPTPDDICQPDRADAVTTLTYTVHPRSVVALFAPPR